MPRTRLTRIIAAAVLSGALALGFAGAASAGSGAASAMFMHDSGAVPTMFMHD